MVMLTLSSWLLALPTTFKNTRDFTYPSKKVTKRRTIVHWESPLSGRLKINFGGLFREAHALGGIRVIVRDEHGNYTATLAKQLPHVSSPLQVNLEACKLGLLTALQQGLTDIVLESDCKQLVAALEIPCEDCSDLGRIVDDCKDHLKSFNSFHLRHISCKANGVALRLAHLASFSALDECWLGEAPSIIEDVLFEDFCNRTRG